MEDIDRISDLPDAILIHILSSLHINEAVVTSVLSTRWRYLYPSVSTIKFDWFEVRRQLRYKSHDVIDPSGNRLALNVAESFRSFLDRMLFDNRINIDKFRLTGGSLEVGSSRLSNWISAAVQRGVKHIDLRIRYSNCITFSGIVFTCNTLMDLKLNVENMKLDVPKDFHCPNLKTLRLENIRFPEDDSIKSLLSGCCGLEDMVIDHCILHDLKDCDRMKDRDRKFYISHPLLKRLTICSFTFFHYHGLMIDTPNLAYLKYSDHLNLDLENLPSLDKADINILGFFRHRADAPPFFRGICNVRSLILSSVSLMHLLSCKPLPVFATLEELEIWNDSQTHPRYNHWKNGFETLMTSLPRLERVSFYQDFIHFMPEKPSALLFKPKVMEISDFYDKDCIGKVKYILKNGGALEKVTIRIAPYVSEETKLEISQLLLASPRESKQCCILVV